MRRTFVSVVVVALALCGFGNLTLAQKEKTKNQEQSGHPPMVELSGAAEVPGPGDTDGSGTASLTLNPSQVCYEITVTGIEKPTAAHIHAGPAGQSGPVKVPFKAAADGKWKGCADADADIIKDIRQDPANYYVNVHNAEFPQGALRGQLAK